ncbi:MAG: EAL domain-containing protein [Pseudomonadota bacterium]|nr:EAL domain-containing protein [Pseudomonadota bacterium]
MWKKLRELMTVAGDDLDLVKAQYRVFAKQIPLLYFILCVNTLAIVYTFARFGHQWITAYLPGVLVAFCISRGFTWWRRGDQEVSTEAALRLMRATTWLGIALAAVFSAWGFAIYGYGDAYAKGQMVFFLALTMIACTFCLTQLRAAALSVAFIGVGPYSVYFFFADHGNFRALAVILALVSIGMVTTILRNYDDFARLVISQRALLAEHKETLRLGEENSRLANLDPLTGLANRRRFIARLTELSGAAPLAMAFLDLDGFKTVNDEHGHEVGDALIAYVAKAFAQCLPEGALLARLGGDEFAALVSGPEAAREILAFAKAACARLEHALPIGARSVHVGVSIGVATAAAGDCDAHELLRRADVAMYHVKANGKGGVKLYGGELDHDRRMQSALKDEICGGLDRGEFEMHYQPIVDARSKEIVSVEALLRWPARAGGPLGPDAFIPTAEGEGLIDALGLFALRRACEDFLSFDKIAVSVNVSPAQFRDPDFERKVARVLAETGFPAQRLSLEVTEGYLIGNPERAASVIDALKAMGASVVLDDFGAGYTSIAYLQKYGFSAIKIDRSLVARIGEDEKARVLVTGVIYLANGLDMPVTAEGVETEEQARLLRLAGCQNLQGFRFYRPKPLRDWLGLGLLAPTRLAARG